jgi:hypothetical protein
MSDSVHALGHDHLEINRQVLAVGALLRKLQRDGNAASVLVTALGELCELLFFHFAREEEGVFPFIADAIPELAERARAMSIAHDTICGALARTFHLASAGGDVVAIVTMYERFEVTYASHASLEASLLEDLDARLDPAQRATLVAMLKGL